MGRAGLRFRSPSKTADARQKGALALYSSSLRRQKAMKRAFRRMGRETHSPARQGRTRCAGRGRYAVPAPARGLLHRQTPWLMIQPGVLRAFVGAGALLATYYAAAGAVGPAPETPVVCQSVCTPPDSVIQPRHRVGYIIDNSADDRDILSAILWFASQGLSRRREGRRTCGWYRRATCRGRPAVPDRLCLTLFPTGRTVCQLLTWGRLLWGAAGKRS